MNCASQLLSGDKSSPGWHSVPQREVSNKDPQQMGDLLHYGEWRMECEGTQLSLGYNLLV